MTVLIFQILAGGIKQIARILVGLTYRGTLAGRRDRYSGSTEPVSVEFHDLVRLLSISLFSESCINCWGSHRMPCHSPQLLRSVQGYRETLGTNGEKQRFFRVLAKLFFHATSDPILVDSVAIIGILH